MLSLNCKNVQHVKIYLPCNFEVNTVTDFGVISLFSSNYQHFNTFRPLFKKLLEINVQFKLQTCSACHLSMLHHHGLTRTALCLSNKLVAKTAYHDHVHQANQNKSEGGL